MPTSHPLTEEILKEFDTKFILHEMSDVGMVKDFLSSSLTRVREDERERFAKEIYDKLLTKDCLERYSKSALTADFIKGHNNGVMDSLEIVNHPLD